MDALALFFLIISIHQVANGAGTTFGVTDNQYSACVDFFAAKPMDTKVMRVVEAAFIPSVINNLRFSIIRAIRLTSKLINVRINLTKNKSNLINTYIGS